MCTSHVHFGFNSSHLMSDLVAINSFDIFENNPIFHFVLMDIRFFLSFLFQILKSNEQEVHQRKEPCSHMLDYPHMQHPARVPPEPAEHVASVAAVSTVVTPGEPVVELSEFVLSCQVHLLI